MLWWIVAHGSGAYSMPLIIRHSDEDLNKHANHSAYARFFEDAKEVLTTNRRNSSHDLASPCDCQRTQLRRSFYKCNIRGAQVLMLDTSAAAARLREVAIRYLSCIIIAYQAEARALDVCEIKIARAVNPAVSALDVWIYRTVNTPNQ